MNVNKTNTFNTSLAIYEVQILQSVDNVTEQLVMNRNKCESCLTHLNMSITHYPAFFRSVMYHKSNFEQIL